MPETGYSVSKNDFVSWRNPLTPLGIVLHEFDRGWTGGLQIHECGYLRTGADWHFDGVCSPFWRLYHNTRPGSHIEIDGRRIPLLPNRILVVPANKVFDCRGGVGTPHLWIHFSFPASLRFTSDQIVLPLHPALRVPLGELRGWFRGARSAGEKWDKRRLFHLSSALLHSALARLSFPSQEPLPAALSQLLEHIERSLSIPLINPVLAKRVNMSVEGFIRWFRLHQDMTPARYVARRRVQEACRLLTLTDDSIETISEKVGFANRHHFTRIFRQYTGQGPAQFRRGQNLG